MLAIQYLFNGIIQIYVLVIFIMIVMNWLISFNVINRGNQLVDSVWRTCIALTEPALRPIRRVLPDMGGLDLSPLVLFLGLGAIRVFVNNYIFVPLIRQGL